MNYFSPSFSPQANRTVVQSLKTYIGLAKEEWSRDDGGASDMCTLRGHVSVTLRDVGNEEELDIGAAAKEVGGEERNLSVAFALAKAKAKKCACPIAEHNASAPPTRRVLRGMRLSHLNGDPLPFCFFCGRRYLDLISCLTPQERSAPMWGRKQSSVVLTTAPNGKRPRSRLHLLAHP